MEVPWLTSRVEKVLVDVIHRANTCLHENQPGIHPMSVTNASYPSTRTIQKFLVVK